MSKRKRTKDPIKDTIDDIVDNIVEDNKKPKLKRVKLIKVKLEKIDKFILPVTKVDDLNDLIKIGEAYLNYCQVNNLNLKSRHIYINKTYESIANITNHLHELQDMVGLESLKKNIVNQIIFFAQGLNNGEMMHTVLSGEKGVGKTTVGRILTKIYSGLGFLSKGTFKIVKRTDFIGKFLGHTAEKTEKLLKKCIGGVMFIDEAYSLGPGDKDKDSFSKEAIDTLNQFLSENTKDFICIIAGYENSLNNSFFSCNEGLVRRFPWKFNLDTYSSKDLCKIFEYCLNKENWAYIYEGLDKKFEKHKDYFTENGGDCQILFDRCKIVHSKRVFLEEYSNLKVLNKQDINLAFEEFIKNKKNLKNEIPMGLYS
jgi:ABC-type oligopeptide transport system ATPase subunit